MEYSVPERHWNSNFYLVRHAIKEKGIGDVPISSKGILQARATAIHFRNIPLNAVFTSPLKRAKETAAYIAAEANVMIAEDNRLRERANWGDLPGQNFEDFVAMWKRCTSQRNYVPPVGDSARRAGERLSSFIMEMAERYPQRNNVIVSHGGLITDFLVNVIPEVELRHWHADFIAEQSNLVSECSITKVRYDRGSYKLEDFASVEHLIQ